MHATHILSLHPSPFFRGGGSWGRQRFCKEADYCIRVSSVLLQYTRWPPFKTQHFSQRPHFGVWLITKRFADINKSTWELKKHQPAQSTLTWRQVSHCCSSRSVCWLCYSTALRIKMAPYLRKNVVWHRVFLPGFSYVLYLPCFGILRTRN